MPNQAFPLAWPAGVLRTPQHKRGVPKFKEYTVATEVQNIRREFLLLSGAKSLVISTNIPLKMDGNPYSDPGRMPDPGVAVYFELDQMPVCLPCDAWKTVEQNLHAVAMHMDAMRGMRRWGVGTTQQAFAGYKSLPASTEENWWDVLDCRSDAAVDVIELQYKTRARSAHPDTGGSHEAMARLNGARDRAIAERTKR